MHGSKRAVAHQAGDRKGETQSPLPTTIKVPPAPVLSPEEEIKTIQVAPGFRLELVAPLPVCPDFKSVRAHGTAWMRFET